MSAPDRPPPAVDALPTSLPCPYCGALNPGWPSLQAELDGQLSLEYTVAERDCRRCGSRFDLDLRPHRPHLSLLRPDLSKWLWIPLAVWLVVVALSQRNHGLQAVIVLLLVLLPVLEMLLRSEWVTQRARQQAAAQRQELLCELGEGDPGLGERLIECDRRARPIRVQVQRLGEQLLVVQEALEKIRASRFRDRAGAYGSAADLLRRQISSRETLLRQFQVYRRDLEALVAARRAEAAFTPLDPLAEADTLDAERVRLTAEADALLAAAEVADELRTLGIGPLPELGSN